MGGADCVYQLGSCGNIIVEWKDSGCGRQSILHVSGILFMQIVLVITIDCELRLTVSVALLFSYM